jgi:dCTP deaminase
MILSDKDIRWLIKTNKLVVDNLKSDSIRENGIDCRIRPEIAIDVNIEGGDYNSIVDTHNIDSVKRRFEVKPFNHHVFIPPRTNILLATIERFEMPDNLMAFCALRSTVARMGFVSPITIVDAGFRGTLTIEAFYGGKNILKLYEGDRFLHVIFAKTSTPVEKLYDGVYNNQESLRLPKIMN